MSISTIQERIDNNSVIITKAINDVESALYGIMDGLLFDLYPQHYPEQDVPLCEYRLLEKYILEKYLERYK
jgi:hypothetical protein